MSQSRKIKKLTILFSHRASGRKLARLVRWGSKREIDRERGGKNIAGHGMTMIRNLVWGTWWRKIARPLAGGRTNHSVHTSHSQPGKAERDGEKANADLLDSPGTYAVAGNRFRRKSGDGFGTANAYPSPYPVSSSSIRQTMVFVGVLGSVQRLRRPLYSGRRNSVRSEIQFSALRISTYFPRLSAQDAQPS